MSVKWTTEYLNWFELHVRNERSLQLDQWYLNTANLIKSDIQRLYQMIFVSRQFTDKQTIRIMIMWLDTTIDNRLQQRFLKLQERMAKKHETQEWRREKNN